MSVKLGTEYKIFPLEVLLHKSEIDLSQVVYQQQPVLLLSQIKEIDRTLIEQMEQAGIYDSDDFFSTSTELQQYLGLNNLQFEELQKQIEIAQNRTSKLPRVVLDLPKNYAIISCKAGSSQNKLGILWRGIQIKISRPKDEYWNPIKYQFEKLLKKMEQPELIGRITLPNPPHWIEQVTPLSTYIGNISLSDPLLDTAMRWGLPLGSSDQFDPIDLDLLALTYLIRFAQIH